MPVKRVLFLPLFSFKTATVAALVSLVTACGGGGNDKTSQVVAQVDGAEITVHQLNAELGRLNVPPGADAKVTERITANVLRTLVDQQLLVAQAKKTNLERSPEVVQAIELAKRQILTRAYIKQLASAVATPGDKEIADYYAKHPELFQNRKLYTLRVLVVSKQELKPASIDVLQKSNTLAEVETYLKSQNIIYKQNNVTHPAEEMPMDVLPKMVSASAGQLFLIDGSAQVTIYDVVNASDQPIAQEQARPIITRFLSSQSNEQRVRDEVNRLRKEAKIAYLGKFAGHNPDEVAALPVIGVTENGEKADDAAASTQSMDRGMSGLK